MIDALRGLTWEEAFVGNTWSCRFHVRQAPGCSIFAVIAGGAVLVFLRFVGPYSVGGGAIPVVGTLMMAVPIVALALKALSDDIDGHEWHQLHLDQDTLRYQHQDYVHEVPIADIGAVITERWGVVVKDRSGNTLLFLSGGSANRHIAARLGRALVWAREPRTYRG